MILMLHCIRVSRLGTTLKRCGEMGIERMAQTFLATTLDRISSVTGCIRKHHRCRVGTRRQQKAKFPSLYRQQKDASSRQADPYHRGLDWSDRKGVGWARRCGVVALWLVIPRHGGELLLYVWYGCAHVYSPLILLFLIPVPICLLRLAIFSPLSVKSLGSQPGKSLGLGTLSTNKGVNSLASTGASSRKTSQACEKMFLTHRLPEDGSQSRPWE